MSPSIERFMGDTPMRLAPVLAAIFACIPFAAFAQTSEPAATGAPHGCLPSKYYPARENREHVEGVTHLSLSIAADGSVSDASFDESSGSSALDAAAEQCAKTWKYKPAMQNGVAVPTPAWKANVRWLLGTPVPQGEGPLHIPRTAGAAHVCDSGDRTLKLPFGAYVKFTIQEDGSVTGAVVTSSSGDPDFDAASAACVSTWRFQPVMEAGKPMALPWRAIIDPPGGALIADENGTDMIPPVSPREGHHCSDDLYPRSALNNLVTGGATVGFTIGTDGKVSGVKVITSSGSPDIDQASIACVSSWTYRPAMRAGVPVATPWRSQVKWDILPGPFAGISHATGAKHHCGERPRDPANPAAPGLAVLDFAIDTEGNVTDLSLQQSSGDKVFDAYAMKCVSAWQYTVTAINGVPVRTFRRAHIDWNAQP
jgi:TonB family protein